jgi:predicted MFS family arabinose efflux permease
LGSGLGLPTLPFYTIGIFAPILAREFGWSFASIFGGLIVTTLVLLFGGPLVGHLVDRHGPRTIAAISLIGLGLGYMTLALSTGSIVQYYASWAVLSVAGIGATSISFTRAINSAFIERRGLALGIALSGIGLFAFAVKPLAGWLTNVADWRMAIVAIGLLPLLIGAPVVLWGLGTRPVAKGVPENALASQPPGLTLKEAVRTRAFAILVCAFVVISFANGAPIPHLENILRSVRMDPDDTLATASLIGIAVILGRLIGGWLLDRIWAPIVGIVVVSGAACGCWILAQQTVSHTEAMAATLLLGFAGGVEGDLLSYLIARYMGVRSYGAVYGTIFGLFALGAGAGPSLIGYAYDRLGSYSQILMGCALLLVLAAGLLLCLGRYPGERGRAATPVSG